MLALTLSFQIILVSGSENFSYTFSYTGAFSGKYNPTIFYKTLMVMLKYFEMLAMTLSFHIILVSNGEIFTLILFGAVKTLL